MSNIYIIKDHFEHINISRTLLAHLQSAYVLAFIRVSVSACAERSTESCSSDMAAAAERSLKDLVVHNRKKTLCMR